MKTGHIALRGFTEADLPAVDRFATDPDAAGQFGWAGFAGAQAGRRRFAEDGFLSPASSAVAVAVDDTVAGMASWEAADRGGPAGGCFAVRVALLPDHRSHSVREKAHALLADYLFRHTRAHRLETFVDSEDLAAQQALEKAGFHREGLLCQAFWRDGGYRDQVVYALLREG
ncbi:GNAT family N-acetyltransferase [Amycolatopsis benzoatilytica]|uniref:GNAT family N-acetyltransferase n=1 Tax=Amycolatopsis benzoatilytica TaxID=346045 RepID=UPI00037DA856|nr:GNAT family protein [Amycolatopsis benzoatilytica]